MQPTILTVSGNYFDFNNPENSVIDIVDIAHALSNICRFTGHVRNHFSVAQHSVMVSRLVPPKFALMGLLHDASEAYLGDVASPLKMMLPDYKLIEARVEKAVLNRFGMPDKLDPCIKVADLIALATEKRDLMPESKTDWEILKGIKPCEEKIRTMYPITAYNLFLDRFDELMHDRDQERPYIYHGP